MVPKPHLFNGDHYFCGHLPQDIDLKSTVETSSPQSANYVRSERDHQWRLFTQQGWSRKHTNFSNPFCPLGIKTRSDSCITYRRGTWKALTLTHMRLWPLLTNKITEKGKSKNQSLGVGTKLGHLLCSQRQHLTWASY